jgi:hypothetical protein
VAHRSSGSVATLAALALALAGCERGCLSTWLVEQGVGRTPDTPRSGTPSHGGTGPQVAPSGPSVELGGTDCSDGLARCTDGNVEISLMGHVPHPCAAPKERSAACACPWKVAGRCSAGCVSEGLEVAAAPEVALVQLCAPVEAVSRPVLATEATVVTICADDGVSCVDGIVRSCAARGQPAQLVSVCVHGCAPGATLDPDDLRTGNGPAAILCRRAHAERQ